jgi:hypothetical protein
VEAATKPPREDTSSEDSDVKAGAYDKGSNRDEAAASAVRRAYAASGTTDNPKATASAARCTGMARAAIHMAEANTGAYEEGSNGDEAAASAARRAYAASDTTNNPKVTTATARRRCMAKAAVHTTEAHGIGNGARNEGSGNIEAEAAPQGTCTHQALPPTRTRQRPLPRGA